MDQKAKDSNISDHKYSHPPFTERQLADIERIKSILDPVYPLTIDEWQDLLLREKDPAGQLAWWLSFTDVYREHTKDMSVDECSEAFERLLSMTSHATPARPQNKK
jgi:hypothetical protein